MRLRSIPTPLIRVATCLLLMCGGAVSYGCAANANALSEASGVVVPRNSEIAITREQFGTAVSAKVGDTITIQWPNPQNWHIDFGSPPLQLIDPTPGQQGWRFRAIASGDTDVTLTLITIGDAPPPRQSVTIHVS